MINYTLVRAKRKTVSIRIRNGSVEVRAPLKYPLSEIDRFVSLKEKWIIDKLVISQKQKGMKEAFSVNYGDKIYLLGAALPIIEKDGLQAGFDGGCFYLPPNLEPDHVKEICVEVYRRLAESYLATRVAIFADFMGTKPTAVKISGAKKRWGSCSSRKSLNFSWRLIMASEDIIDYVIVHELAHLTQMNHSRKFWAIVESMLPDYRDRKKELCKLGKRLAEEDWG